MQKVHLSGFILLSILFFSFLPLNVMTHDKMAVSFIETAGYLDLDDDTHEDDVLIVFRIELKGFSAQDFENGVSFGLSLQLVLPSGKDFKYLYFNETHLQEFYVRANLYNHATESGWYEVRTLAFYGNHNPNKPVLLYFFEFDPPGGQTGDDPKAVFSSYP